MVRHECAEALGSIATDTSNGELGKYLDRGKAQKIFEKKKKNL